MMMQAPEQHEHAKHFADKGEPRRKRGILPFPWRRRVNTLTPADHVLLATPREHANAAISLDIPTGDVRRQFDGERVQALQPASLEQVLRVEFSPTKLRENRIDADTMRLAWRYLRAEPAAEPTNPRHILATLIAAYPLIDAKDAADREATAINTDILPPYQPDPELARRLKFMRYLVQRGTFNEGDGPHDGTPPQQRSFTADYDDTMLDDNHQNGE